MVQNLDTRGIPSFLCIALSFPRGFGRLTLSGIFLEERFRAIVKCRVAMWKA